MCSGKREKRNYQEHKKASFLHLSEFQNSFFSLLLRKCLIRLLCGLLLLCCSEGKHSNSRSQIFYDALQNLAIFTEKHLRWRFFLINFSKKRFQHSCFPVNTARCLSTAFYVEIYVNMSFVNIMLCYHFSLEALFLQDTAKNNPTENNSKQKLYKATSMRQHEN